MARYKKYFFLLKLILILGFIGAGAVSVVIFSAYKKWESREEQVLSKLVSYKKQLDMLRKPFIVEEEAGTVQLGAVSVPSRIYDKNGVLIGEYSAERRTIINIEKIPKHVINALIAGEDHQFYEHSGFNYKSIFRAFIANIVRFRLAQGGSTISQQLAKVLFTNQEKTIERKLFEVFCTLAIEGQYTKKQILEMYLNLVYMGHGTYGIESASMLYYNKSSTELNITEAATLIALLPNPKLFSPLNDIEANLRRVERVLLAKEKLGYLPEKARVSKLIAAYRKKWVVKENEKGEVTSEVGQFQDKSYRLNLAPFFLHEIKQLLQKEFSEEVIMRGGLRVYTTLDFQRQRAARDQLINSIQRQQKIFTDKAKKYKKSSKKYKELTVAAEKTEGAFISLDPLSGYTLTMVGGKEFSGKNMFNRSLLAKRQLGSVIKPLIFYLAIKDKIITPAMLVEDKPLKIGRFDYNNYDNKYLGKISWLDALRKSRNTTAVRLLQLVGIDELHEVLAKILNQPLSTIKKKVPREMGVALGTPVFTPMEVAKIYATIASGGIRIKPRMLLRVDDVQGKVVFKPREIIREEQVLDKTATFILLNMMKETFSSEGTARWVSRLRGTRDDFLAFDVAGKTGTTSDYRDAWFAGLTSDEVSIVWLGTDNNYSLGSGRSGGAVCSPVWVNYIQQVRKDSPPQSIGYDWKLPGTIKQSFCNSSGGVPRSAGSCPDIIENAVFYEGTEPRFFDSRPGTQEAPGNDPVEDPVIIPTGDL